MIFNVHPEASKEIEEAFKWYEEQQSGLGMAFVTEAEAAIHRIAFFPELNSEITKGIRRAIMPLYPYGIIYSATMEFVEIYAIAHLHRKPFYWKNRIKIVRFE